MASPIRSQADQEVEEQPANIRIGKWASGGNRSAGGTGRCEGEARTGKTTTTAGGTTAAGGITAKLPAPARELPRRTRNIPSERARQLEKGTMNRIAEAGCSEEVWRLIKSGKWKKGDGETSGIWKG